MEAILGAWLVLLFHYVGSRIELRWLGFVENAFTCWLILPVLDKCLLNTTWVLSQKPRIYGNIIITNINRYGKMKLWEIKHMTIVGSCFSLIYCNKIPYTRCFITDKNSLITAPRQGSSRCGVSWNSLFHGRCLAVSLHARVVKGPRASLFFFFLVGGSTLHSWG